MKHKIISSLPFFCIIFYAITGLITRTWHPTWLIFFLIPIVTTFLNTKSIRKCLPIIVVFTYLLISFTFGNFAWTWLLFFIIPLFNIFFPNKKENLDIIEKNNTEKIILENNEEVNYIYHG